MVFDTQLVSRCPDPIIGSDGDQVATRRRVPPPAGAVARLAGGGRADAAGVGPTDAEAAELGVQLRDGEPAGGRGGVCRLGARLRRGPRPSFRPLHQRGLIGRRRGRAAQAGDPAGDHADGYDAGRTDGANHQPLEEFRQRMAGRHRWEERTGRRSDGSTGNEEV